MSTTRVSTHAEWVDEVAECLTAQPGRSSGAEVRCRDCPWSWAVPLYANDDDWDRQQFYAEEHARLTGHRIEE